MDKIIPLSIKDAPSIIESVLPVQRLSTESYKEQMAVHGKTLTALGSYWKGRKPLVLAKACVLGALLPASDNPMRDLEVFEMLMGMDLESLKKRLKAKGDKKARDTLKKLEENVPVPYHEIVHAAKRPEELGDDVYDHIWDEVNAHLNTDAHSFPELVEQLGIMRFGHRPRIADTFCGSGQIPFEAARLGCDVYASDLNPIAAMLTWGAFHIVGAGPEGRKRLEQAQKELVEKVQKEIDRLGIEEDGHGWRAKVFLYCVETRDPGSKWLVPLLPTRIISKGYRVIAELVPDPKNMRYDIRIGSGVNKEDLEAARTGTVQGEFVVHTLEGKEYRTRLSTIRGDYRKDDGTTGNGLRLWKKHDFRPRPDDIFQERLYCIQWMRPKKNGRGHEYEFRSVTEEDLKREKIVEDFIATHLEDWHEKGWIPDMRIEPGAKTNEPIWERGWTYWHHLFNPRQLLIGGLVNRYSDARLKFGLTQVLNCNCRLSRWNNSGGGGGIVKGIFDNQALNTLFNYGCRGIGYAASFLKQSYKSFHLIQGLKAEIIPIPSDQIDQQNDIYITDPPYGNAIRYEEILEFFIAWLRKNPPPEFADWTWDSRRVLAIKGEDEGFRRAMVKAYSRMAELMPDNGLQVIMFTHQSGSIWADMTNIIWASGLQVTAAWYVATETDSALRNGSYVKGTVLLVVRKRREKEATTRDDLGWELQDEVKNQVNTLTGLNQEIRATGRDENVFEDADLQMAGYAAAIRVLTRYSLIDGRDVIQEALRPRTKGEKTFVDQLIDFAVEVANRCLVPNGIDDCYWNMLSNAERFYLKMIDLESKSGGMRKLDDYQNLAKAFKVRDFRPFMAVAKANRARLKMAVEFGKDEMGEGSQLYQSTLRAVLYALMEIQRDLEMDEVLAHLKFNVSDYYNAERRILLQVLSNFLADRLEQIRPKEARAARILKEFWANEKL